MGKALAEIVGEANVLVVPTDVSKLEEVVRLRDKVYEDWGEVSSTICSTRKTWLHLDAHWHRRLPSKFNTYGRCQPCSPHDSTSIYAHSLPTTACVPFYLHRPPAC